MCFQILKRMEMRFAICRKFAFKEVKITKQRRVSNNLARIRFFFVTLRSFRTFETTKDRRRE